MEERQYKKWLGEYSNRHNKNFDGLERYSLTWQQIREIINEERGRILEELKSFALGLNGEDHVDTAIKNCPCDACRIVKRIIEEEQKNK